MSIVGWEDKRLSQLQSPRRNRYFSGKLMDEHSFSMEQRYILAEHRQLNRLTLGSGVLCGLWVSPIQCGSDHGLRVAAGVAIDGWGRRIVVPDGVDLFPVELADECGVARPENGDALPEKLVVSLCYRECQADFGPAIVPDPVCDGAQGSEAATWVETYAVRVRAGTADDAAHPCEQRSMRCCERADCRTHSALTAAAAALPDDPAVVLANVTLGQDGSFAVSESAPRPIVPTNQVLLRLIACLAARIEECCGSDADPNAPPNELT